jgi:hypothetical protein
MKWSESLAAAAQKWADKLAREDKFEHDLETITKQNQGENLAFFSPSKKKCMGAKSDDCVQCSEMVSDWYNEVKDYDFNTGKAKTSGKAVLHFTQVWNITQGISHRVYHTGYSTRGITQWAYHTGHNTRGLTNGT